MFLPMELMTVNNIVDICIDIHIARPSGVLESIIFNPQCMRMSVIVFC